MNIVPTLNASPAAIPQSLLDTESTPPSQSVNSPTPRFKCKWDRAAFKIKAQKVLQSVNIDILTFGTTNELTDGENRYKQNINELIEDKRLKREWFRRVTSSTQEEKERKRRLIMPDGHFRKVWNPLIGLLLAYTATIMPYRLAFANDVLWDSWSCFSLFLDFAFLLDTLVNCFSVTYRPDGTYETHWKTLIVNYLKSWFWVDLIASIPFSLLDLAISSSDSSGDHSHYNSLARLFRLPRLYKLLRIFRVVKAFRHTPNSVVFDQVQDLLHINLRFLRLMRFFLYVFIGVHLAACMWYYSARMDDFSAQTWVMRLGLTGKSQYSQYLSALYWAVTTVVTVGYGDITAVTEMETVLAVLWMIIGSGFYTYTVGSLASILSSIDTRQSLLSRKMEAIKELSSESRLTLELRRKLTSAVTYHTHKQGNVWSSKYELFNSISKELRYQVASAMYDGVVQTLFMLKDKGKAFVNFLIPLLNPVHIEEEELIFSRGEYPDEVFFIANGKADFIVMPFNVAFKSYLKGSYIGEVEILFNCSRIYHCRCVKHSELFTLRKSDLCALLTEFPYEEKEMRRIACERYLRDKHAYEEMEQLLTLRQIKGSLKQIVGKAQLQPTGSDSPLGDISILVSGIREEARDMKHSSAALLEELERLGQVIEELTSQIHLSLYIFVM